MFWNGDINVTSKEITPNFILIYALMNMVDRDGDLLVYTAE
jgi:hypothetical protein